MKKGSNKTNKIIIALVTLVCLLGITNIVHADDNVVGPFYTPSLWIKSDGSESTITKIFNKSEMLPQNNINGNTGLMPQWYSTEYEKHRNVLLSADRYSNTVNSWNGIIDGDAIYCSLLGAAVRYGSRDYNTYYLDKTPTYIVGLKTEMDGYPELKTCKELAQEYLEDSSFMYKMALKNLKDEWILDHPTYDIISEEDSEYYSVLEKSPGLLENKIGFSPYSIYMDDSPDAADEELIKSYGWYIENLFKGLFEKVESSLSTKTFETTVNGNWVPPTITSKEGPVVVVLENDDDRGYKLEEEQTFSSDNNLSDTNKRRIEIEKSYVLSAMENAYNNDTGNFAQKYSIQDIQTAYWLVLSEEGGGIPGANKRTVNGELLYKKAKDYAEFIMNNSQNYNPTIDSSNSKIIVDRANSTYYVGPIKITYPECEDLSYIKSMKLTTINEAGKVCELSYGQDEREFTLNKTMDLILDDGSLCKSGNGLTVKYPKSGKEFFIKFDATATEYPTDVNFSVKFEYLDSSSMNYQMATVDSANVYQYISHYSSDSYYIKYQLKYEKKITYEYEYWYDADDCEDGDVIGYEVTGLRKFETNTSVITHLVVGIEQP